MNYIYWRSEVWNIINKVRTWDQQFLWCLDFAFFLNKLRKYLYSNQFGGWLLHLPEIFDYCPEQLLLHFITRTERVPSSARSVWCCTALRHTPTIVVLQLVIRHWRQDVDRGSWKVVKESMTGRWGGIRVWFVQSVEQKSIIYVLATQRTWWHFTERLWFWLRQTHWLFTVLPKTSIFPQVF